jgi:hypothetical protein
LNRTTSDLSAEVRSEAAFVDRFDVDVSLGKVVGSLTPTGVPRRGVDKEGVLEIDHGALRIRPLIEEGWGRSVLTYGPYARQNGLMFATFLLNGHNTSQSEVLPESMKSRLVRWLQGHGNGRRNLLQRSRQWVRYPRKGYLIRKVRTWRRMASGEVEPLDENLAVGWFAQAHPVDPNEGGNAFVMHAALGNNGELWVRSSSNLVAVDDGIQNVPMCYVTILRDAGAAYYVASVPDAHGAANYPLFRPCAIDTTASESMVFGGVHQSALGQIGFRVDTRVFGVQIEQIGSLANWFGTAHAADLLEGEGPIDARPAERGGHWSTPVGAFERHHDGVSTQHADAVAVLRPDSRSGLLHLLAAAPEGSGWVGLVWRFRDPAHHYRLEMSRHEVRLLLVLDGQATELARTTTTAIDPEQLNSIQLVDDGRTAHCIVNGQVVFPGRAALDHLWSDLGVGICATGTPGGRLISFEAHPSAIDFSRLVQLPAPWFETGEVTVIHDDFTGPHADLTSHATSTGGRPWHHEYGPGTISLTGDGSAAVEATIDRPNPGSTAYTVEWDDPSFVDLSVEITPPGTSVGQRQCGRGGLILWDDPDNFLTISMYLDDAYDGASIAIFSHLDGFEDIYDAVWSMVGKRIYWGVPHRLRVVSDGIHLMTFIDDEPVLYRAITDIYKDRHPLRINRVGLAVNWEWGDDTGTRFAGFTAKIRGSRP